MVKTTQSAGKPSGKSGDQAMGLPGESDTTAYKDDSKVGNKPRKWKILIVDDDESVRALVKIILEDYEVIEAANGAAGAETASLEKPDLILLDVLMPRQDGILTCREIKANPETQAIPVVMITGFDNKLNQLFADDSGSDGYLTKPFDARTLRAIVRKLCECQ